jgi:HlyD family secretion protein
MIKEKFIKLIGHISIIMLFILAMIGCSGKGSSDKTLKLSGTVEATTADLAFKTAGRLAERFVDEGASVDAGSKVARLDDSELYQEAERLRGGAASARAVQEELETGFRREDIARAASAEAGARSDHERAVADFQRVEALFNDGVISKHDLDSARSARDMAKARLDEAVQQHLLMKRGSRKEEIDSARAQSQQASAAAKGAEIRLRDALLLAPFSGIVLSKHAEPGEVLAAGAPVVTLGDIAHPWIRAYLEESDLGRLKIGASAKVATDTFPGKVYNGRVSFISTEAEFTPKTIETKKERVKLVYRIKVEVDNPSMELKPGMPADVEIQVQK